MNTFTDKLITDVKNVNNLTNFTFTGFASEAAMLTEWEEQPNNKLWAGIVFTSDTTTASPTDLKYTLRVTWRNGKADGDRWRTELTYPFFQAFGPRNKEGTGGEPFYHDTGFLTLQYLINKEFIKLKNSTSDIGTGLNVSMQKMPYPPYLDDVLATVLQSNLPLFLVFSFILNTIQMAMNLAYEKEKKLKEAMKMMGLKTSMYWISWFVKNLIYLVLVIIAYTLIFSIKLQEKGRVINYADMSLFFVFLLLYILALIAFAFMVSTFFSKANSAAFAAGILYFLTYFPYFFLTNNYETMSKAEKYVACLLHNQAMAFGIKSMLIYEGTGEGAQWSNFYEPGTVDDNFALIDAMVMLIVDTVLYMLIAWYVDNINPGEAGIAQPPWFPFLTKYWCGKKPSYWCGSKVNDSDMINGHQNGAVINPKNFERDPPDARIGISIRNLRKMFDGGVFDRCKKSFKAKVAVENTTLNMFEGQITSLLGHNGAGKTTTISMLTGFMSPTSGSAIINGYDIRTDIEKVRQNLGLCPQHNILFDLLTVEEHLYFFAKLKGCDTKRANNEVREMIKVLGMEHKRNALSSTLSGGQKRKLSVGIALIAGSKVVILDEPTSGMDPAARRQTWEILQKYREGRIIILTTHFMDEADILGDRIAIMSDGVVKCCGTSMFLKKLYGAGYHMVIVKGQSCNVDNLTALVKSRIPSAQLKSQISAEVTYVLPFSESKKFEGLFKEIEAKLKELGVNSFGVSATTMEEVFLKVGEGVADEDVTMPHLNVNNPNYQEEALQEKSTLLPNITPVTPVEQNTKPGSPSFSSLSGPKNGTAVGYQNVYNPPPDTVIHLKEPIVNYIAYNEGIRRNTGAVYAFQQFYGMLVKKFIHATRNIAIAVAQLLLPIIFTILALSVEKAIPDVGDDPALVLNMNPWKQYTVPYSKGVNSDLTTTSYADAYKSLFGNTDLVDRTTYPTFNDYFKAVQEDQGISTFNRRYIVASDFDKQGSQVMATAHFNGQPYHGIAISLQFMMNGILRKFDPTSNIEVTNHPLPKKESDNVRRIFFATNGTAFTIAISILFGMAFMATSFIIFLIKERSVGAKHLQAVSGVRPFAYWLSCFVWDMFNYLVPVFIIMILFAIFGTDAYVNDGRLGIVFLIFLLYGWSVLPFVYMLHFLFNVPSTGMVAVSMINLLSGLIFLLATYTLSIPLLGTEAIGKALEIIFIIIFPNYDLGLALMDMYTNSGYKDICGPVRETVCKLIAAGRSNATNPCCFPDFCGEGDDTTCFTYYDNFLQWEKPGIGREILFMAIQGVVFFAIVLLAEYGILSRIKNALTGGMRASVGSQVNLQGQEEDSDVAAEARRINASSAQELQKTDSLILKNVDKIYDTGFHAVKNISCGIPKNECFGLLGQNGAGKTSTFKMLTGDEALTSGNAYLNQYSVKSNIKKVQQNLGYCPQFDALIDQMTGRETLYMYARLRGIEESQISGIVERLINIMMLQKHADKETGFYSGGNKRKLSTAIALIGDPPFIFLDEPTTGMDPGARRQLWNVLSDVRASGRTLILTSHSMEECDALCTRLVIMVNGRFVCLGSPQHLKNKFGHGYTLFCRMGLKDGVVISSTDLVNHLKGIFKDLEVFDTNQGYVHFRIPDDNAKLAQIFGVMEQAKEQFEVDDYSVHQTTLEQIFLTFTQNQVAPKEKDKKKCCKSCC
ncbi:phospholipid-transporting ATPase ABCA3-like [Dreissena polymorpha]|uniref:phospholipid-transporting ATPase ABCA3-like n=1 Tax=Dreissena polymorpha TaxID=45954 RepID=UPI0022646790|nr:phospholipid-transporting ATPase ABCA3-like [Dreissena polymorpha]